MGSSVLLLTFLILSSWGQYGTVGGAQSSPSSQSSTSKNAILQTLPPCGRFARNLTHQGLVRQFFVEIPPDACEKGHTTPIVFAIHGFTSTAESMRRRFSSYTKKAGMVLVTPEGYKRSWNGGACCGQARERNLDDLGFLRSIVEYLRGEMHLKVDPGAIFATGHSNGGFLISLDSHTARVAPAATPLFSAIVPVSGLQFGTADYFHAAGKDRKGQKEEKRGGVAGDSETAAAGAVPVDFFGHMSEDDHIVHFDGCCVANTDDADDAASSSSNASSTQSARSCCCGIALPKTSTNCSGAMQIFYRRARWNKCELGSVSSVKLGAGTAMERTCFSATEGCKREAHFCAWKRQKHAFMTPIPMVVDFFAALLCSRHHPGTIFVPSRSGGAAATDNKPYLYQFGNKAGNEDNTTSTRGNEDGDDSSSSTTSNEPGPACRCSGRSGSAAAAAAAGYSRYCLDEIATGSGGGSGGEDGDGSTSKGKDAEEEERKKKKKKKKKEGEEEPTSGVRRKHFLPSNAAADPIVMKGTVLGGDAMDYEERESATGISSFIGLTIIVSLGMAAQAYRKRQNIFHFVNTLSRDEVPLTARRAQVQKKIRIHRMRQKALQGKFRHRKKSGEGGRALEWSLIVSDVVDDKQRQIPLEEWPHVWVMGFILAVALPQAVIRAVRKQGLDGFLLVNYSSEAQMMDDGIERRGDRDMLRDAVKALKGLCDQTAGGTSTTSASMMMRRTIPSTAVNNKQPTRVDSATEINEIDRKTAEVNTELFKNLGDLLVPDPELKRKLLNKS